MTLRAPISASLMTLGLACKLIPVDSELDNASIEWRIHTPRVGTVPLIHPVV